MLTISFYAILTILAMPSCFAYFNLININRF